MEVMNVEDTPIAQIESLDVFGSPGTEWVAYVKPELRANSSAVVPTLHLLDAGGKDTVVGVGSAPLWMSTGARLAYLRPVHPEDCTVDGCPGRSEVVVLEPATRDEQVILDKGKWSLLGWAGNRVLVADAKDPSTVSSVSLGGNTAELGVAASEVWEASPDGRWLVTVSGDTTSIVPLEDGRIAGEGVEVPLIGKTLAGGAWSHDSSTVAAVALSQDIPANLGKKGTLGESTTISEIVVFSPEDAEPRMVEESFGATGNLLWSVGNDGLVFSKVANEKKGLFQSFYCPVETTEQCRLLLSFTQDVVLLRME
jgi:hypothetical protein